jgi:nitrous oxide reductase accessory protein NosL
MKRLFFSALVLGMFITACDKIENEATLAPTDITTTEVAFTAVAGEDNVIDLQAVFSGSKSNTTYQFNTKTANGSLELVSNKYVKYTPDADVSVGEDQIEIRNGDGGSKIIKVMISAGEGSQLGDQKCGARGDRYTIAANAPATLFSVLRNDKICKVVDTTTLKIAASPKNGIGTVKGSKLEYTPNKDFIGQDFMVYEIKSKDSVPKTYIAFVDINVVKKADPGTGGTGGTTCITILNPDIATIKSSATPTATIISVLKNDKICDDYKNIVPTLASTPKSGTAVVNANSTISYTANASFKGTDVFEYQLTNAAGKAVKGFVKINVVPDGNTGGGTPTCISTLLPDKAETKPELAVIIDVLKNDKVCDLTGLAIADAPTKGTVVVTKDNKIVYTPNKGISSTDDKFAYSLVDPKGNKFLAIVVVTISK